MAEVAEMTVTCMRDPATELISSDGDIDRYLSLGPVQPKGFSWPITSILVSGKLKSLKFQEAWFEDRPWLEYSVSRDEAGCFYCRLFKPLVNGWFCNYLSSVIDSNMYRYLMLNKKCYLLTVESLKGQY